MVRLLFILTLLLSFKALAKENISSLNVPSKKDQSVIFQVGQVAGYDPLIGLGLTYQRQYSGTTSWKVKYEKADHNTVIRKDRSRLDFKKTLPVSLLVFTNFFTNIFYVDALLGWSHSGASVETLQWRKNVHVRSNVIYGDVGIEFISSIPFSAVFLDPRTFTI